MDETKILFWDVKFFLNEEDFLLLTVIYLYKYIYINIYTDIERGRKYFSFVFLFFFIDDILLKKIK